MGVSPGVIRHDLHFFGRYGKHGCGYDVKYLYKEIGNILKLNITYNAVIIGTGKIGNALCKYYSYKNYGIEIKGLFDINPKIIGIKILDMEVHDIHSLTEFLKDNSIDIGIICAPIKAAHNICDNYLQVE